MKKLIFLFMLSLMSFGSMAMGFPHSTFAQQRALISKSTVKRVDFLKNVETEILNKVEEEKISFVSTMINNISNFFVSLFSDSFLSGRELAKTTINVKNVPSGISTAPNKKVIG